MSAPGRAGALAVAARELYRFHHVGDDEVVALRGVSLFVDAGELVAVTGPSGSGKSTLVACLAGLDEPDGGSVAICGEPMTRRSEAARAALRRRSVGLLSQTGDLFDHLTVADNVALVQRLAREAPRHTVGELLEEVGLGHRAVASPAALSGGEAARAGLAVALANDPPVILADEPTGELDESASEVVLHLLRRRSERGAAVVVATHDRIIALAADREVALIDGRVEG